jgi:hypothetical protein
MCWRVEICWVSCWCRLLCSDDDGKDGWWMGLTTATSFVGTAADGYRVGFAFSTTTRHTRLMDSLVNTKFNA